MLHGHTVACRVQSQEGNAHIKFSTAQQLRLQTLCMQTLAIWKVTWRLFLGALPFKLINDAATFVGPIFLNLLLGVVSEGKSSAVGYSYAGLMFVGLLIGTLCDNQHFQRVMRAGAVNALLLSSKTPLCTPCSSTFVGASHPECGLSRLWLGTSTIAAGQTAHPNG